MRNAVLCALIATCMCRPAVSAIIRVKWDSPTDGPGNDWAHAYHTVAAAIAASQSGDEIWVAGNTTHPYLEQVSLKDSVGLYGGFFGTETVRAQRDWQANATVLDGDGASWVVDASGNSSSTILDGFTIRNASSGIYATSHPTITHNTITNTDTGVICSYSMADIAGNVITGNNVGISCHCLYCYPFFASPRITSNTVAANGQGIVIYDTSPFIANNIVAFNGTGISSGTIGYPELKNNCVHNPGGTNYDGLTAGEGDIWLDPLFADRIGMDFHLMPSSPCIDRGLNPTVAFGAVDVDGDPRILPVGGVVDIGADEFSYAVADAKALAPDGQVVYLRSPVVVTGRFSGEQAFYVECADRSCGIRCSASSLPVLGQTGSFTGVMGTTANGERVLTSASVVTGTLGSASVPTPVLLSSKDVGGGQRGLQEGVRTGSGLNNIGLLVRVAGKVTFIDPARQFFTVSDGAAGYSGAVTDPAGHAGVRISAPGTTPAGLKVWDFVTATGIVSCAKSGTSLYPRLLVRSAQDIVVNAPTLLQDVSLAVWVWTDAFSSWGEHQTGASGPVSASRQEQNDFPGGSYSSSAYGSASYNYLTGVATTRLDNDPQWLNWIGSHSRLEATHEMTIQGPTLFGFVRYAFDIGGAKKATTGGQAECLLELHALSTTGPDWSTSVSQSAGLLTDYIAVPFGKPFTVTIKEFLYAWLTPTYRPYSGEAGADFSVSYAGPYVFDANLVPLGQLVAN